MDCSNECTFIRLPKITHMIIESNTTGILMPNCPFRIVLQQKNITILVIFSESFTAYVTALHFILKLKKFKQ